MDVLRKGIWISRPFRTWRCGMGGEAEISLDRLPQLRFQCAAMAAGNGVHSQQVGEGFSHVRSSFSQQWTGR
uniref:Uncharacterized protein n=1 Tax=alpha proteobacterium U95 TaxID=649539 RepID=M4VNM7_9PROT|nr:hypothetical protein [alpha proteobacterium U95]